MIRPALRHTATAAIVMAFALGALAVPAHAAGAPAQQGDGKLHPVDATKNAGKAIGHGVKKTTTAIGHGFRDGARAVGHGARNVTRTVGHAFRDGAHKVTGKKD